MLAVPTFAVAAAMSIPCASTQGDDSRTALCETWCSEFVYEFGTLDYALWPQKHCVYCKCRDCGLGEGKYNTAFQEWKEKQRGY